MCVGCILPQARSGQDQDKPASPPPAAKKSERAMTLELQKEKAERAKLLAETERLKKQLDAYSVRESKRKQSEAAEPGPPAKRAVTSGRRTAPQSAAVSRRRLSGSSQVRLRRTWSCALAVPDALAVPARSRSGGGQRHGGRGEGTGDRSREFKR